MKGLIVDWIGHNARILPNKLASIDLPGGRSKTYSQMHDRVGRIAGWLAELGVQRGDRVAVLMPNSSDILDTIFATWRIGAIHVALNVRLTPFELNYILGDAEPKVLIFDGVFSDAVKSLSVSIEHTVETDGLGGDTPFEAHTRDARPVLSMVDLEPDDPCMLMYSSGTTGSPKGVIFTHGMMLWANVNAAAPMGCSEDMVSLSVMPLFHIGGLQVFSLAALYAGGTAVIMRSFDPGQTLDAFSDRSLGVTHFLGVPAIYNAMRDHPKVASANLSRLRVATAGGEAIPDGLVRWWSEHGVVIQEGYGMTENTASCSILRKEDVLTHIGSAGKACRHTQIRIVRHDGTDADFNESGEIWCRGPVVTPGYWRLPDANQDAFVDGWLRTGDVGSLDAEGFIYIKGRLKDMYISGGENVYPAEVENTLRELPEIREVAVIGVPDERWGEVGCAVVAVREGMSLDTVTMLSHCRHRLAPFKLPRHVVVVDELPRNASGKVLKPELRKGEAVRAALEQEAAGYRRGATDALGDH